MPQTAVSRSHSTGLRGARRLREDRASGQSLVEFALILPVLMLLMLIAVDFGRVYLGYINLQNMARVAANFAANNPDAWLKADTTRITKYRNQVLADAAATNCALNPSTPADPVFSDATGDDIKVGPGDNASVAFSCTFKVITPLISAIVGGDVTVSASSVFPVKSGQFTGGGSVTSGPAASFTGSPRSVTVGSSVTFTDTSSGSPTTWSWDFGDGGTSAAQNPVHPYTSPGTYTVVLSVSNSAGSSEATRTGYITVTAAAPVASFTGSPTSVTKGSAVTFTDTSSGSPTAWSWNFGDGQTSSVGPVVSHAYQTTGTYTVTLTVTGAGGPSSATRNNYITVTAGTCKVPAFDGTSSSNAQATWSSAGFSTTVQFQQGGLPWTIKSQNIVAGSSAPCDSTITVSKT